MINIILPETPTARRLSFYLVMEEFVARQQLADDAFFLWQVEPSVIYGRNQVVENEVNIEYCQAHGIQLFQRKSGGGCVYADRDNLMLSFITKEEQVGFAFNRFVNMVLLVLRKMGVEATGTRHNDILIGDRKVCGTACRKLPSRSIVHSTMLYDTNMEHMLHAITPTQQKLAKNGVESVRQRITLLKDYTSLTLDEIKALIIRTLCDSERLLTADEVAQIEKIEEQYY
jgi:lipoic acid synthetase/lipoate-protein ligase A